LRPRRNLSKQVVYGFHLDVNRELAQLERDLRNPNLEWDVAVRTGSPGFLTNRQWAVVWRGGLELVGSSQARERLTSL